MTATAHLLLLERRHHAHPRAADFVPPSRPGCRPSHPGPTRTQLKAEFGGYTLAVRARTRAPRRLLLRVLLLLLLLLLTLLLLRLLLLLLLRRCHRAAHRDGWLVEALDRKVARRLALRLGRLDLGEDLGGGGGEGE